ncbi:hypothetical protein QTA58_17740 [Neorhizobium sp. CSC1952]|uniref:hypothetical protein n=1 Tax=Neorhizobium sp. CSC1952 TaxID=2978974 RepID=UPI0025A58A22|nr:hypothetical protein [Rhizobium sp. CSC1952]WJR66052.1 hypothetical protein QTA58_17740 [Rhizobium sp. CSC1952]
MVFPSAQAVVIADGRCCKFLFWKHIIPQAAPVHDSYAASGTVRELLLQDQEFLLQDQARRKLLLAPKSSSADPIRTGRRRVSDTFKDSVDLAIYGVPFAKTFAYKPLLA